MPKSVQLYEWPFSQICMECENGYPVMSIVDMDAGSNSAICLVNHVQELTKGDNCSKLVEKEVTDHAI